MSLVSVFIAIYNEHELVEKAIESVLTQSYRDLEVFLLDDGSEDPGISLLLNWSAADPRMIPIRFPTTEADRRASVRYATTINWAAERARGEFFTFLAGDDFYYPDRIERMVERLNEGHDIVYGSQARPNANGRFVPPLALDVLTDAFHRVDMSSVMMRRQAFEAVGGFNTDPSLWRDGDSHFWRKLTDAGYVFVPVDDPYRYTDAKIYRDDSVDARMSRGETPWSPH